MRFGARTIGCTNSVIHSFQISSLNFQHFTELEQNGRSCKVLERYYSTKQNVSGIKEVLKTCRSVHCMRFWRRRKREGERDTRETRSRRKFSAVSGGRGAPLMVAERVIDSRRRLHFRSLSGQPLDSVETNSHNDPRHGTHLYLEYDSCVRFTGARQMYHRHIKYNDIKKIIWKSHLYIII